MSSSLMGVWSTVLSTVESLLATPLSTVLLYASVTTVGIFFTTYLVANLLAPTIKIGAGTHVIITGGSSGIGLAVAKEYLQLGADVTIIARDAGRLKAAEAELREQSERAGTLRPTIRAISCDVGSSENMITRALVAASVPDCDILINCAGTSIAAEFSDLLPTAFEVMLRVNVLGSIYPTRALVQGMKRRGGGRIVFVSSQVAQCALHGYTAYAASKWALRGLAEALQMELKPFGIYVSVAYPPDTQTPGYTQEMLTKPAVTKALSDAGSVFSARDVARDLVYYSRVGYFGISTGLDGWLLKQLHAGMTPVNNAWEVLLQVAFSGLCRVIGTVYLLYFDAVVKSSTSTSSGSGKGRKDKDK